MGFEGADWLEVLRRAWVAMGDAGEAGDRSGDPISHLDRSLETW
jgi:hypothetical protein